MNQTEWGSISKEEQERRTGRFMDWLRDPEFAEARLRLRLTLNQELVEAPEYRAKLITLVSRRAILMREPHHQRRIVPWGWTAVINVDSMGRRDSYWVGPWWLMLPRVLHRRYWHWRSRVHPWTVRVGLVAEPSEGCYYHELIWFPRLLRKWRRLQ